MKKNRHGYTQHSNMPLDDIKELIAKFSSEELKIDKQLDKIETKLSNKAAAISESKVRSKVTYEEIVKRNKQILKELETVKGNLRSKAIYSPSEMQWENICTTYRENPSLQVTTYRCHLPVFV